VLTDDALRSPHNGNMTVLARMGVPGLLLWTILQCTFALKCFGAYIRARRIRHDGQANLYLWLLSYWLAFMINMTFSVALEGPHSGIWFWSLIGFTVAEISLQAHAMRYTRTTAAASTRRSIA
jgi:O-antigen ligase